MHLIVDIRSATPTDPIIARYASDWVDLWSARHSEHRISYIHFSHQECPDNGSSVVVRSPTWWWRWKRLSTEWNTEIFRCINFSRYSPYDTKIPTLSHVYDHGDVLYPRKERSWVQNIFRKKTRKSTNSSYKILVPSLSIWQESVSISHTKEENIEIIPYITLEPKTIHTNILTQLSISGKYWLYDGTYGSEANIKWLLLGYKKYRELWWTHIMIFMWQAIENELRHISDMIQELGLTGLVRIIWTLDAISMESVYTSASGWIYIGAYYTGGPRIELAHSLHIPLLISKISSLEYYSTSALSVHPNHLSELGNIFLALELSQQQVEPKISNKEIMQTYEKLLAEKS